jgi:hypothetical protein
LAGVLPHPLKIATHDLRQEVRLSTGSRHRSGASPRSLVRRSTAIRPRADSGGGARRPAGSPPHVRAPAVAPRGAGAHSAPAPDGVAPCCTSRQSDTHRIESREVRYPWHPWYGRAVWIDQAVVRGGRAMFQCRLELRQEQRSVEVPQWMFDAASCHWMRLGPIPSVSWEVLRELRALLSSGTRLGDRDELRDAQHQAEHGRGGADATVTEPPVCPPAVHVSPAVAITAVGDLPARDPRADRGFSPSAWSRARRPSTRCAASPVPLPGRFAMFASGWSRTALGCVGTTRSSSTIAARRPSSSTGWISGFSRLAINRMSMVESTAGPLFATSTPMESSASLGTTHGNVPDAEPASFHSSSARGSFGGSRSPARTCRACRSRSKCGPAQQQRGHTSVGAHSDPAHQA